MTIDKLQQALADYVDAEFTAKLTDYRKWIISIGVAQYVGQLPNMIKRYAQMLTQLGIYNEPSAEVTRYADDDDAHEHPIIEYRYTGNGEIDLDKAYKMLRDTALRQGKIMQPLPLIGEVGFGVEDIDRLYDICKRC